MRECTIRSRLSTRNESPLQNAQFVCCVQPTAYSALSKLFALDGLAPTGALALESSHDRCSDQKNERGNFAPCVMNSSNFRYLYGQKVRTIQPPKVECIVHFNTHANVVWRTSTVTVA